MKNLKGYYDVGKNLQQMVPITVRSQKIEHMNNCAESAIASTVAITGAIKEYNIIKNKK